LVIAGSFLLKLPAQTSKAKRCTSLAQAAPPNCCQANRGQSPMEMAALPAVMSMMTLSPLVESRTPSRRLSRLRQSVLNSLKTQLAPVSSALRSAPSTLLAPRSRTLFSQTYRAPSLLLFSQRISRRAPLVPMTLDSLTLPNTLAALATLPSIPKTASGSSPVAGTQSARAASSRSALMPLLILAPRSFFSQTPWFPHTTPRFRELKIPTAKEDIFSPAARRFPISPSALAHIAALSLVLT
jgi:hypothetical protein